MKKLIFLIKGFFDFLFILYKRRALIFEMALRDITTQHIGSLLGFFWTFINPAVMILIMWFVFSVAFKYKAINDVPYIVWLTSGMIIWNTFSEAVNSSVGSILYNSHLAKKVVFPLSILPVVKLTGTLITHTVFISILILLLLLHKMPFSLYWVQGLYYLAAMSVLVLGLGWITSSINIFAKDTGQVVSILLQIGFWGTPVFWNLGAMPMKVQFVLKLNPMFYIVQGYRESFIYFIPFWEHWQMTLYFWGITGFIFLIGAGIFLRLRPHFADVL